MEKKGELDHFKVLEEKVGILIEKIRSLRDENGSLKEKIQTKERGIAELSSELEGLKESRNRARERIVSILEKIEESGA